MDIDLWMRHYATQSFFGNWDTYGFGRPKNLRMYVRPEDGKVIPMAWDSDRGNFTDAIYARRSEASLAWTRSATSRPTCVSSGVTCWISINRSFNEEYVTHWANHYNETVRRSRRLGGEGEHSASIAST